MFRFFKKNIHHSNSLFSEYMSANGIKKLQIGCGRKNILDGWLNTDIVLKNSQVAYLDAGKKFPLENNTFHFVFSEHIFEHLNFEQAVNMLSETYRVLKPGGILRISTPNMNFLINLYLYPNEPLNKSYIEWATKKHVKMVARNLKSDQYTPVFVVNNFFRDWGHQIIHNFESIQYMLTNAGFTNITPCEINQSAHGELQNLEMHGETIPPEFNALETMVIEAEKPYLMGK